MLSFSRREFLSLGAAALAGLGSAQIDTDDILRNPRRGGETSERARVLNAAQRYLREQPETIVSVPAPRSAGGPHDYFSEADYFWPDPQNPNGPYINRDGESNPGNFNAHHLLLIRLSIQMPALAAAWVLTKRRDFAAHAAAHLRAWFIEPATRMNPDLQYAQAVHGLSTGRSYGNTRDGDAARAPRARIKNCRNKECRMEFCFLGEQVEIARAEAISEPLLTDSSVSIGS